MINKKGLNDAEAYKKIYGDLVKVVPFYNDNFEEVQGERWE